MATFTSYHQYTTPNLPFKVQAQIVKNLGFMPIYIFGVEDDLLVPSTNLLAYSVAIIDPGCTLDLTTHPYITALSTADLDREIGRAHV